MTDVEILKRILSAILLTGLMGLIGSGLVYMGIFSPSVQTAGLITLLAFFCAGRPTFQWWTLREYQGWEHLTTEEKKRQRFFDYESFDTVVGFVNAIFFFLLGISSLGFTEDAPGHQVGITFVVLFITVVTGVFLASPYWRFLRCLYRQGLLFHRKPPVTTELGYDIARRQRENPHRQY